MLNKAYADQINATNPGAIHSTEIVVSGRSLHVKVVYNRDRGVAIADAQPDDGAGTPAPGRSKPTKPAAGKPKAHKAAGPTPNAPADQAGLEQRGRFRKSGGDADQQPVPTDPAAPITAAEAEEMRTASLTMPKPPALQQAATAQAYSATSRPSSGATIRRAACGCFMARRPPT